jgi:hypothetical protein
LYACWSWLISFSMIMFKTSFDLIQATIQDVTWLKVNPSSWLCKYQNCTLTLLSDMFTFNLATICCSQGLNFTSFLQIWVNQKDTFWVSIHTHCCNELL